MNMTTLGQEDLLKNTLVRFARIPHLKDDFDVVAHLSPLAEKRNGSSYYKLKFTPIKTFVLQEKFYRQIQELESSLKF